ncbi:hypothetical protein [Xanthomonas sp. MUS 060]|uniref:hypothetical protein n=1 Tax=Xanthomonas sp. MUS 060 TaxID=1588031 RepID=UPI0006987931|nr:hypothetical protein [Xanthomonas sp. MUS 060]
MTQLPLPISPSDALTQIIVPALDDLTRYYGMPVRTDRASAMLLSIAMQESELRYRRQIKGPARSMWMFEPAGVSGLLARSYLASCLCRYDGRAVNHSWIGPCPDYRLNPEAICAALGYDDVLAAQLARLLLMTLPQPLPELGDEQGAWQQYIAAWRPGKPSRERWAEVYPVAVNTVRAAAS